MKAIEDMCKSHPASTMLSYSKPNPDGSQGEWKRLDLEYYYSLAKNCSLPESAPENIRQLWETAQHLLLYSFYEYPFVIVADLYSTMAVETALKQICDDQIKEYNRQRVAKGMKPRDPNFTEILEFFKVKTLDMLTPEEADFLHERLSALRKIRGSFAHPAGATLYPATNALMIRSSEWLGSYYTGQLKQLVIEWIKYSDEEAKRFEALRKGIS